MLDKNKRYDRVNNILFENGEAVYKFTYSNFINVIDLEPNVIDYMIRYMEMWPDLYEPINEPINKNMRKVHDIIRFYYDFETTGTDWNKHAIHQMYFEIEVNGVIKEKHDFKVRPHDFAIIEQEALDIAGVTEEEIWEYPPMEEVYIKLIKILKKYVDRFNRYDKMFLVGYNNKAFDDFFFRAFFSLNNDPYYGSWFWSHSIDVMCSATEYLIERRQTMPNFKLKTVAKELGIEVDEEKLHDAEYDCELMRMIYYICIGLEIE